LKTFNTTIGSLLDFSKQIRIRQHLLLNGDGLTNGFFNNHDIHFEAKIGLSF